MLYFEHKWLHSTLVTCVRRTRHKNRTLPSGLRSSRVWRRAFGVKSVKSFFLDYLTSYLVGLTVKGQAILERSFETFRTTHTITQQHIPQDELCRRSRGHSPPFHHGGLCSIPSTWHLLWAKRDLHMVFPTDIYTSSFSLSVTFTLFEIPLTVVSLVIFTCFSH